MGEIWARYGRHMVGAIAPPNSSIAPERCSPGRWREVKARARVRAKVRVTARVRVWVTA